MANAKIAVAQHQKQRQLKATFQRRQEKQSDPGTQYLFGRLSATNERSGA